MSGTWIVAGTGSRSLQTADPDTIRTAVQETQAALVRQRGIHGPQLVVMSGMAEGFDYLLAWTALRLNIPLWCAVPNRGYGAHYWGRNSVTGTDRLAVFEDILARALKVTYVMEEIHDTSDLYLNGAHSNFVRNSWMIERADEFVVWDPTSKGTAHCLAEIRRAGLPYRVLSEQAATLV